MTYENLATWVSENYDMSAFRDVDELIDRVKADFVIDGVQWQEQFVPFIQDKYEQVAITRYNELDPDYQRQQRDLENQRLAAELLGNGQIARGYSDDMVESFNSQRSEIMDIDFSEFSTTQEQVTPPEIRVFSNEPVLTRVKGFFASSFRRTTNFLRYGL